MEIAIVTLDGFNEIDSFVALSILNRARGNGLRAVITGPGPSVTSMNGVEVRIQEPLSFTATADVVLFGSGIHTRDHINDPDLMAQIQLDPSRQMIGAQCSGVLFLHKLGLLRLPVITLSGGVGSRTCAWHRQGDGHSGICRPGRPEIAFCQTGA